MVPLFRDNPHLLGPIITRCHNCDTWAQPFWDGDTLVLAEEACPYTEEVAFTRVTIPVPSGRLVLSDMLDFDLALPPEVDNLSVNPTMNRVTEGGTP